MPGPTSAGGDSRPARWHPLVLVPLALAAWVYHPITGINFFADDLVHLASIESDPLLEFLLAPFGGHNYLVRNLAFLLTWKAFGLHPFWFYVTVLLTHLVNVALLFEVVWLFTGSATLACFGASLWGTSPLCLGTLSWYSVYGHVLVGTILLFLLARLGQLARTGTSMPTRTAWMAYALLLAGTTCFGVGIGVALAFPAVLFLILPETARRPALRIAWLLLPVVTIVVYFAFRRLYALLTPITLQESMQEYMATHGFSALPPQFLHLLAFSAAGSTLGFALRPGAYPSTLATAAIVGFLAGLVLVFWRGDATTRRTALAMLALAGGVYLVIAAGRSNTYAMFNVAPSQAARVARYHYVGSLPSVILVCLMLRQLGRLPGVRAVPAALALATGLAAIAVGILRIGVTFQVYPGAAQHLQRTANSILADVRAVPVGQTAYLKNEKTPGYVLGPSIPNFLFPGRAAVYVLLHREDELEGRTVRFVDDDPEVASYCRDHPHTRLARLIVSSESVPGSR